MSVRPNVLCSFRHRSTQHVYINHGRSRSFHSDTLLSFTVCVTQVGHLDGQRWGLVKSYSCKLWQCSYRGLLGLSHFWMQAPGAVRGIAVFGTSAQVSVFSPGGAAWYEVTLLSLSSHRLWEMSIHHVSPSLSTSRSDVCPSSSLFRLKGRFSFLLWLRACSLGLSG